MDGRDPVRAWIAATDVLSRWETLASKYPACTTGDEGSKKCGISPYQRKLFANCRENLQKPIKDYIPAGATITEFARFAV